MVLGLFYYFSDQGDPGKIWQNVASWFIIKAGVTAIAELLVLAHPLAILGAALASTISVFNPIIKPQFVAGLVEAKYNKPRVRDFERLAEDSGSFFSLMKNKVFRIVMVMLVGQFSSNIGFWLWGYYMTQQMSS